MTTNLEATFPDLFESAMTLYDGTHAIVIVLLVVGFSLKVWQSMFGDPGQMIRALLGVAVVALIIEILPALVNDLQLFAYAFIDSIGASPDAVHERFAELILGTGNDAGKPIGFWDVMFGHDVGLGEAISYALVYLASQCAWAISYLCKWLQHILLIYGTAVAPIFVAFFMLDALRPVAAKYFLGLVSLAFWPLGWAIADVLTENLIRVSVDADGSMSSHAFWAILMLTLWILFSTIAAPLLVSKILITGANAGSVLIKGFVSAITMSAVNATGSAVTTLMMGAGKGAATGGALASGAVSYAAASAGSKSTLPAVGIGVTAGYLGKKPTQQGAGYSQRAKEIYDRKR